LTLKGFKGETLNPKQQILNNIKTQNTNAQNVSDFEFLYLALFIV